MVATLARGAFLFFLAATLVFWALTLGNSSPAQPAHSATTFYLVA